MANIVVSPISSTQPTGATLQNDFTGPSGDKLVSDVHGKFYNQAIRGNVFNFSAAAVTLPVNAATLASKFGLYNPPASGVNLELLCFDACSVVATTVVDGIAVYYSNSSNATGATFTTAGTAQNAVVGLGNASKATPYSAVTHVGTPVLHTLMGTWGAVSTTAENVFHYEFEGRCIVPPGCLIAVAMTTAASTASGITLELHWAEVPIV